MSNQKSKKEVEDINRKVYGKKTLEELKKIGKKKKVCLMWINIKNPIAIF